MYNSSEMISAHEINQYIYCANQWYNKRLYGDKRINEFFREKYGAADPSLSRFERGKKFHKDYYLRRVRLRTLKRAAAAAALIAVIAAFCFVYFNF